MDTFDRFSVTVSGATLTKTSSADDRARQMSYPDSEFALVVVNGARKVRLFPMSKLSEVGDSERQLAEMLEHRLLPEKFSQHADSRLRQKSSALGGPASPPDVILTAPVDYWSDEEHGMFWRGRENQHVAKTSAANAPEQHPVLAGFEVRSRTVELRTLDDVRGASALLDKESGRMSSTECRGLAKAVVQATMALGGCDEREALGKFSADSSVAAFAGTLPRPTAPTFFRQRAKEVRLGKTSMLDPSKVDSVANAFSAAADALESWQDTDPHVILPRMEKMAEQLDQLTAAAGLKSAHSHTVLFLGHGEDAVFKTSAHEYTDGFEYTFGSTHIRASEIERLANVHLGQLNRILGREMTDKLQQKPLETFRTLSAPQKRAVARFCEETIKVREMDGMIPNLL